MVSKAITDAKKRYYVKNREKIIAKNSSYNKENYTKNQSKICERNLNNYHYKQFLKIMLEEDVPCN